MSWSRIQNLLGASHQQTSHGEKWLSATGATLGIGLLCLMVLRVHWGEQALLLATCMGASAVLVFAVPGGALSQPWPVLGGYTLSALAGVTCARFIDPVPVAAGFAVGCAVLLMYYLRCLHPPGGAAALVAVLGGDEVQSLGYWYVVNPILVSAGLLVLTGVLFSLPFPERRYPWVLARRDPAPMPAAQVDPVLGPVIRCTRVRCDSCPAQGTER